LVLICVLLSLCLYLCFLLVLSSANIRYSISYSLSIFRQGTFQCITNCSRYNTTGQTEKLAHDNEKQKKIQKKKKAKTQYTVSPVEVQSRWKTVHKFLLSCLFWIWLSAIHKTFTSRNFLTDITSLLCSSLITSLVAAFWVECRHFEHSNTLIYDRCRRYTIENVP